jgi:hypothetical protein
MKDLSIGHFGNQANKHDNRSMPKPRTAGSIIIFIRGFFVEYP